MASKIACIVQARRRSTRLPDKILQPLAGRPALEHALNRCKAIESVDQVICAGVDDPYEQPIVEIASQLGISSFRGSETDVLARYFQAAKEAKADWVMRVTSDCPLFDPDVANELVTKTMASGAPFGSNARWPHGLDCEVFTFDLLEAAYQNATSAGEREHVTLWMKRQNDISKIHHVPPTDEDLGQQYRWVLDYPEDYAFMKKIYGSLGDKAPAARWQDVTELMKLNPEWHAINATCADAWAAENKRIHNRK